MHKIEDNYLNPKTALRKGLSGITEEEFRNSLLSFAKEHDDRNNKMIDDNLLKEKYPFYKQLMKMSVTAVQDGDERLIAHFSGMVAAYKILLQIAEEKN